MNNRIIYINTDGGISVIIPAPNAELSIEQIAAKDVPPNTEYKIVDVSEIPADREFRSAWEHVNDKIEINFDKAKEITKKRLREERKSLLAQQDVEFLKAIEMGSDKTEIIKEKKRLRDITKLVDEVTCISELKQLKAEKPKPEPKPEPTPELVPEPFPLPDVGAIPEVETPTELINVIDTTGGTVTQIKVPINRIVRID